MDEKVLYFLKAMKTAYGTFLTSLLVIKCHDMVADQAAAEFNVTWTRTTPIVVSCLDGSASSLITGEMDHRMGMDVLGDPANIWAFRFACSSAFSPIEEKVANPDNTGKIGSVTMGIGERILNGETPELFYSNDYIVYKIKDKDDLILLLDPETGIVRDVSMTICGVYCFHNQITDRQIRLAENLTSIDPSVRPDWYDSISDVSVSMSVIVGMLGTVTLEEGAVLVAAEFFAPAMLIVAPLVFLEIIRPGAIEEAEENGMFNTAEYLQNNDLQDQMWDVMLQFFGMGSGPPTGVWDESNEYIQNNPNVQRNLQDIKNLKEQLYSSALELFLPDNHTPTLDELYEAYWKAANLVTVITEDEDTELYNILISQKDWKKLKETLSNNNRIIKINEEWTGDIGTTPKPNDPNSNFLGFFVNRVKSGITKLKNGDIKGGVWDMVVGLSGIEIGVGSVIVHECIEALGHTEAPGNNTTTSGNANAASSGGGGGG